MKIYRPIVIPIIMTIVPTTPSFALSSAPPPKNTNNYNHNNDNHEKTQISEEGAQQRPEPEPEPEPQADASDQSIPRLLPADPNDGSIRVLQFGETLRFEEMGPVIINVDGTTRRIANWDDMTEGEQEVAWRRIKKRNEERRIILEAAQRQAELEIPDGE